MKKKMKNMLLCILLVLMALYMIGCISDAHTQTNHPSQSPATTEPSQTTAASQVTDPTEGSDPSPTQQLPSEPEETEPEVTEPEETEPEVTEPEETQPEVTEPEETEPEVTEPEETQPEVTEPEETEPEVTEPEETQPEVTEPTECPHDYKTETKAATCTQDGYTDHTCTRCGDSYRTTIDAKGHQYGSWTTTEAATCTQDGTKTRSCSGCDKKETKTISATGHQYGKGTVIQEATSCSALGTIRYSCKNCGESYDTTYQGCHTFGEPYKTMFSGIRIECTECGYFITDFYTWREDSYSDCDKTAALYCDTIRLKESTYTGALSTWSEEWLEWHDLIMDVLRSHGNGGVCLSFSAELSDHGGTEAGFMEEYNTFLDAFEAFYGWRPVMDGEPEVYEGTVYVYFDCEKLFPAYESGTKSLSSARKNAIVEDLIAFHIHAMGLRDGMQAYNSMGAICDYMYYRLLSYDHNYRYNSAFRGLTSGITMCQGYAELFKMFCDYCGLSCEIVEGTMYGEAHAWNWVTFSDGTVRYVDVTNLGYDYYILVPAEAMAESHKLKK